MQGGVLHANIVEQLSALNLMQLERVVSVPLSRAAAERVKQCFGISSEGEGSWILSDSVEPCSQALLPALLLQALSITFERYTGYDQQHAIDCLQLLFQKCSP